MHSCRTHLPALAALALTTLPALASAQPGVIPVGSPLELIHTGPAGSLAQAAGWMPDAYGSSGIWLEHGADEGGGFFADGNIAAIWSPGDASVTVRNSPMASSGVVLAIWDEDQLGPGSTAQAEFVFSSYDAFAFRTWTGAGLTSGGIWVNNSDRALKENVTPVDAHRVLAGLRELPIYEWNYIAEDDDMRHVGPMAQDFHAAFGLSGTDDRHIATVDADGVMMASIVALASENDALRSDNARLGADVRALEARLERIEAALGR